MIGFPLDEKEDDMKSFFLTGENEIDNIVFPIINKYSNEELRRILTNYSNGRDLLFGIKDENLINEIKKIIETERYVYNSFDLSSAKCPCCGKSK